MSPQREEPPPLLTDHTFVVQLHTTTQPEAGQMTGRVEHLVSRQATMFGSLETLLHFIARVLREVRHSHRAGG